MAEQTGITASEKEPEKVLGDGRRNPAWLRWAYRVNTQLMMDVARGVADMPKGYNAAQVRDLLNDECKASGFDPKHLQDTRTDAQVYADTSERIIETPESVFEQVDKYLEMAEQQMKSCVYMANEQIGGPAYQKGGEERLSRATKWMKRLATIRRLKEWARLEEPKNRPNDCSAMAWRITHILRYMIWVDRPGGSDFDCYTIGEHHVKGVRNIFYTESQTYYDKHKNEWLDYPCEGCMLVWPPGHGKTSIMTNRGALRVSQNPRLRVIMLHAQAKMSEMNLANVVKFFDDDESVGRRNRALFDVPPIEQVNASTLRLKLPEKQRQPTIKAAGMKARFNGADADELWVDDPCDQELSEQPTERERIWNRWNGTWRARQRGKKPFELITTTLWHHDDPNSRMLGLIRSNKIKFRASIEKCGGPEDSFKPVWPEVYPASKLRAIYTKMQNHRLYSAAYQANPQPDELRAVKRLAYYDPNAVEHREFMGNAIFHVSLDPAATAHERSDKASYIYAGIGEYTAVVDGQHKRITRVRIIDSVRLTANQTAAVEDICNYAQSHNVHYIHAEMVAGFAVLSELFDARGLDVISHQPGNKSKGVRLKYVAPMLDDSSRDKGLDGAVVEFPGKVEDGKLVSDKDGPTAWLEDQILNFGVATADDGVDATTQLLKHLAPDMNVGYGGVTSILREQEKRRASNPRLAQAVERLFGRTSGGGDNAPSELAKWSAEEL